jgi:hypothetical protein
MLDKKSIIRYLDRLTVLAIFFYAAVGQTSIAAKTAGRWPVFWSLNF